MQTGAEVGSEVVADERADASAVSPRRRRILVADDNPAVLALLAACLADGSSALVDTARDGIEAVCMLLAAEYDVVVSDLEMPGCCGFTVASIARRHQPWARVVILSAAGPALRSAAEAAGATSFLEKPFEIEDLLRAVNR